MFTALEGLVGMGTKNGLGKTPTVASVLNLSSLSPPPVLRLMLLCFSFHGGHQMPRT